ncbi:sulfonate ABC transporter permease [Candidatus Phycorickettsia trachydisci]|uniref:Sulfonate ABC transporter permease n=1 Tax=Candidatus Phycorickettsia trachydisci TaxID=2115978 RepID=A0A2P1P8C3_9RICK|nr:ABC transporter permease subunit [Candidatus Phycorickettsia trachydisci]AVP87513.1 sulfonate ABC transporter permease [Candidatus Phycorickettsia trachydisci]
MSHYLSQFINNSKSRQYGFLANLTAIVLVIASLAFFSWNGKMLHIPISKIHPDEINLEWTNLIFYGMRTIFRMIIGIFISLVFSICYASIAASNKRAEQIMMPILDVLQSVPILGYISFTTAGFIALAPGSSLGFEMVAIFAIFTSQAWNITFAIYQSFKNIPSDLLEVAAIYNFSGWRTFWSVKFPFAIPGIIWNCMLSMSGAWFFIVAAECISYNGMEVSLPGIGSYIALALDQKDIHAIMASIVAMISIIFLFDQMVFQTLLVWSNKFCYSTENSSKQTHWLYTLLTGSNLCEYVINFWRKFTRLFLKIPIGVNNNSHIKVMQYPQIKEFFWVLIACFICYISISYILSFLYERVSMYDVSVVFMLTLITFLRIIILSALISLIFVPLGIYIGTRPILCSLAQPVVQMLASMPANLFFPLAYIYINRHNANPDIWLSPLLIVGSAWYLLFNIISGASQIPYDFLQVAQQFNIKGLLKYKKVLIPAIMPYYVTGLITMIGGAWNASIIAEIITWGGKGIHAHGIGSYIAIATQQNDFSKITLGISIMSFTIVLLNKLFWQKAYVYVNKKYSYVS